MTHLHKQPISLRPSGVRGTSLVEFALVLPLLLLLIIGGSCLLVRFTYRDSLDEAAEQAAWAAARTGGDPAAIQSVIARSAPFIAAGDLRVCVQSAGYHSDVTVRIAYTGTALTNLPFFHAPLDPAFAVATNQQERAITVGGCAAGPPQMIAPPLGPAAQPLGPAAQPLGPALNGRTPQEILP